MINQNISQGSATSDDTLAEYDGPSLISWARKFNCLPRLLFKALESGQKIDLLKKEKEKKSLFDEVCELYKAAIDGQGKSKELAFDQGFDMIFRTVVDKLKGG